MSATQKTFARNFLVLFTGNSAAQLIPFLLAPLVARIFSPEELGVQENFLALVSMIAIVAAGRYDLAIVLPKEHSQAIRLFRLGLLLTLIVSGITLLAGLFPQWINHFYNNNQLSAYTWWIACGVFLLSLHSLSNNWSTRMEHYKLISAGRMVQSLVQNAGYLLLGYAGWGVLGLIIAWLLGLLFPVILLLVPAFGKLRSSEVSNQKMWALAREYKDFPLVNSLHAFTDIFASQVLIYWLITKNYGLVALGLFAITSRYLRAPLNLISSAISQLYYKDISKVYGDHTQQSAIFNRSLKFAFYFMTPPLLLVLLAGPWLFATYLGTAWAESGEIAQIMVPAIFFNFMASVVSTTPIVFQRQKTAYGLNLIGYTTGLGLLFIGTFLEWPFQTALLAYSIAQAIYYLSLLVWYKNLINN